ncbi:MAG: hypothetical protein Q7R95_07350 [bacterium]|nr:hypothetical protein [bacterium]
MFNFFKKKKYWTRCKYCLKWIYEPCCNCPKCGRDIDRQLAGMTDEQVDKLFERV